MRDHGSPAEPEGMKPYKQAIWEWFLLRAQIMDVYGGVSHKDAKLQQHLKDCGIDYDRSDTPEVGTYSQFADTFSSNDEIAGIVCSSWGCLCGKYPVGYSNDELVIPGTFSLAEIVYEVIQIGSTNTKELPE